MTTYVVGLDRSAPARAALGWARAVATANDTITVAHAWDWPLSVEGVPVTNPSTERLAQEFLAQVVADQADPRVRGRLLPGDSGRAVVEVAGEVGSDAVVVVGHGGSSKAALLLGSTVHHIIRHSRSPVVVVRGQPRLPLRRVVVGIDARHDGSPDEHSLAALAWAGRLQGVERIEAVHADFVPGVAAGPVREPGLESDDAVVADLAVLRLAVDAATDGTGTTSSGAAVEPVVAAGTGAFALIEASRQADLVVVGTHGRSGLVELILGSTSLEVLAHAHCPVAVIR